MHAYRTHTCAQLSKANEGEAVRLSGWVHRKRDHGGVLFVDLRDHYGITQIVADEDSPALALLDGLKLESVITVDGTVKARDAAAVNPNLPTGAIEVFAREVTVQSHAAELPLIVNSGEDYPEETRLKYRFIDLRRERVHNNIMLRNRVITSLRQRMIAQGFSEFQTPILGASSPEGARDYLVPSRLHPGHFYALPQAPQMFKQLLMVAGFDRYFQIAPCFRDEDLRADRCRRILPARFRNELRHAGRRVPGHRAGAGGRVRGILRRQARDGGGRFPAHPLCRSHAEIRQRQARPAQPAADHRCLAPLHPERLRHFPVHRRQRRCGPGDPGARTPPKRAASSSTR